MVESIIRRVLLFCGLIAVGSVLGCASDAQKRHPKPSHHTASQNDFPTAAQAGLLPATVTK
jgi:hypothetical protein